MGICLKPQLRCRLQHVSYCKQNICAAFGGIPEYVQGGMEEDEGEEDGLGEE